MSELEDRQEAAHAIDTPVAADNSAVSPEAAAATAPEAISGNDRDAIAVVEGVSDRPAPVAEDPAAEGAELQQVEAVYPAVSDASPGATEPALLDHMLEDGIASVFAALRLAASNGEIGETDAPSGPLSDDEASDGITFRLLGELDRLWHRAGA